MIMKEWCIEHPYLTFLVIISVISTFGNIAGKIIDLFVKPTPTTVNMNMKMDPPPQATSVDSYDDVIN
jgi:hypothetical protein